MNAQVQSLDERIARDEGVRAGLKMGVLYGFVFGVVVSVLVFYCLHGRVL